MAKWILNRPSEHCSRAELKVAERLRTLGPRWSIRWGFYYNDNRGQRREGDFLVLGPEGGLLVLEVKGGRVRHFASTGHWEADLDSQRDHPLFQLDQEWKGVIEQLEASGRGTLRVERALCLADVFIGPDWPDYEGMPRGVLLGSNDLANFHAAWQRIFGAGLSPVSDPARRTFINAFGKGRSPEDVKAFIDHNEEVFREQLTRTYDVLDMLDGNRQLLVEGGTGSGKTWNAVEMAVRFAESGGDGGGREVLMLTYNRALAHLIKGLIARRRLERGRITVHNWEELATAITGSCGVDSILPAPDASREERTLHYERDLPWLLLECIREHAGTGRLPVFDCLVVDEAQDHDTAFHPDVPVDEAFRCGWWSLYWRLLRERECAPMALFFDSAQRPPFRRDLPFDPEALVEALSQPARARLLRTFRYTRPLFEFIASLRAEGTGPLIESLASPDFLPEGPPVTTVESAATPEAARAAVESIIAGWAGDGLCRPEDVLILHAQSNLAQSRLGKCETLAGLPLVEFGAAAGTGTGTKTKTKTRRIHHTSIHKAKGLDSLAVIMVGVQPFGKIDRSDYQHTWFMGASRAKQMLGIVHCE